MCLPPARTSIVLEPPVADPGVTFARLRASGAEVVQEPTEQSYGVRDCAVRDPAAT